MVIGEVEVYVFVVGQIMWMLWCWVVLQICGCVDDQVMQWWFEWYCYYVFGNEFVQLYVGVEVVGDDIDQFVVLCQFDVYVWMVMQEVGQMWVQLGMYGSVGGVDVQQVCWCGVEVVYFFQCVMNLIECGLQVFEQVLVGFGEGYVVGCVMEQIDFQVFFQCVDCIVDC